MDAQTVLENVRTIVPDFAAARIERQQRRHLDPADFARLRDAGYLGTGIPAGAGGLFESIAASTRPLCDILRTLAHGDPSVALVAAMHPAVLFFWLGLDAVPEPHAAAWRAQRAQIFESARAGAWWGTMMSEPGSGGSILRTHTVAEADDAPGAYRMTGEKHFGSGSGMTSFMITTAVPAGEEDPDLFFLDMRDVPWDGSTGLTLTAEWDGHGMAATQSHGFRLADFPATRVAWPGHIAEIAPAAGAFANCLFTAVIVGIVETAFAAARERLAPRRETLRPYEQVEWARCEMEAWLIAQAYEGMLRGMETVDFFLPITLKAKTAIAELAEAALGRMSKVLGGGTYSRRAPFGGWAQDVRALGFLRPPWALAFDQMHALGDLTESAGGAQGNA